MNRRAIPKRGQLPEKALTNCPHCGAEMTVRLGVKLPPLKARLFDMIRDVTKGRGYIELESLAWVFFSKEGRTKTAARKLCSVHICQLNEFLAGTDYQIRNPRGDAKGVRLERVRQHG